MSAIVLLNNYTRLDHFSQELQCPNSGSSFESGTCDASKPDTLWNPFGTGLLHENFPFPIYYVADDKEIEKIVNCFEKFNNFELSQQHQRSLCSIQINAFMSAAVNAEVCLRRSGYTGNVTPTRYCDPLQGKNVFATLYPREIVDSGGGGGGGARSLSADERFIVVSARIDTTSMFDGVGLGAMDSFVSYATLISTAHIVANLLPERYHSDHPNILFIVFNGESYDYIGSQRFVYDLAKGNFPPKIQQRYPIRAENIQLLIDLGQLDDLSNVRVHHSRQFAKASQFLKLIQKYNEHNQLGFNASDAFGDNFPPTSAQSFLRANRTFPAVTVNSKPSNRFYHSIYDDTVNIGFHFYNGSASFDLTGLMTRQQIDETPYPSASIQMAVRNVSTTLAYTLYEMVKGEEYKGDLGGNPVLADELFYCFLTSSDCRLFHAASRPESHITNQPLPNRYISVLGSYAQESVSWTYRILGFLLGERNDELVEGNCTQLPLIWYAGLNGTGECRHTTQNFSQASSPAFLIPGKCVWHLIVALYFVE